MLRSLQSICFLIQSIAPQGFNSFKIGSHMLLALLAFIPPDELKDVFKDLVRILPAELKPVVKYMKENYVVGTPSSRGRRRTIPARYPIPLWNMYEVTRTGQHRTNNISEGWHIRFSLVIGKHHPDLYSALRELQKEQADTEAQLAEWSMGRRVRAAPKKKSAVKRNKGVILVR
ncbi:Protein-glutamate methylesterase/protein-glutamine glutaminase [Frankliniella fusca]|uniref:Protein-glutamate methylesterase/protein-glutamine glutaminase n=1 Tax=Frankliniella fusca TaxID=407009 RepID=A0AAE1I101_9NEOP|nr:Protein-glutamate methylesterase/protein-glutamine glutaminase [Frankliniella fusca]KAK3931527.1 Protein-glutamate methylesterase/protein-glutamine glutaminase [Frankliniella fusca]